MDQGAQPRNRDSDRLLYSRMKYPIRGHLNCKNWWGSAFWWNRGGVKFWKKTNFIITIRYEILTFSSVGPFFEEGGGGLENLGQKLKFKGFFQLRSPLTQFILIFFSNKSLKTLWTMLVLLKLSLKLNNF